MPHNTLLKLHTETVRPEWIDHNGHMNVAYYLLAFDHATQAFLDYLGIGPSYVTGTHHSLFTLDCNLSYRREVRQQDRLLFTTQLLDFDAKRLHYFHSMYHAEQGYLAATCELLSIHVNLYTRRSASLPLGIVRVLEALLETHQELPRPRLAGRKIGLRRRAAANPHPKTP